MFVALILHYLRGILCICCLWWMLGPLDVEAHPFESQFVGHKVETRMYSNRVEMSVTLELPLPLVEREFQDSRSMDKAIWLRDWMLTVQQDMVSNLWVDLNGQRITSWGTIQHQEPSWKEASKFLVFTVQLEKISPQELQTLSILDQLWVGEPSVFWKSAWVEPKLQVLDTDQVQLNPNQRYTTHLERWEMEETQREQRFSVKQSILHTLSTRWRQETWGTPNLWTVQYAYLPRDDWRDWVQGRTTLWIAMLAIFAGAISGLKSKGQEVILGLTLFLLVSGFAILSAPSTVWVLPWKYRVSILGGFALLLFVSSWRRLGLLGCALLLCHPSWVVGSLWLVLMLTETFLKRIRSKNGLI